MDKKLIQLLEKTFKEHSTNSKSLLEKMKLELFPLKEFEDFVESLTKLIYTFELLREGLTLFEKNNFDYLLTLLKEDFQLLKKIEIKDSLDKLNFSDIRLRIITSLYTLNFIISNRDVEDFYLEKEKIKEFDDVSKILIDKGLINENWAPAVLLLQSIETVINKKLLEKGEDWEKIIFKDRLPKLGIEIKGGDIILNNAFWDLRAKVLHEGYLPNSDELGIIKIGSRMIIEKICGK